MEAKSITKYARISPRKLRIITGALRNQRVEDALRILKFTPKKGAKILYKTIASALSNAENSGLFDKESLKIKELKIDNGPILKRFFPRAQGRATLIRKRTSHIKVTLSD